MSTMIISFKTGPDGKRPYPVAVDEQNNVTSGLGEDDGARLAGFSPHGKCEFALSVADVRAIPSIAVGLSPTFSDGENLFLWNLEIDGVVVR